MKIDGKLSTRHVHKKENLNITGSGNLTLNARVENYVIENCKDSFDFYNNFFDELKNDK